MEIDISTIIQSARKRKLNDEKVKSLADSFALLGQLQPITITKSNLLLSGMHRLEAAKMLGWETIKAEVFIGDEFEAELVEIDENLMRNELTVLEQGEHLLRRKELIGMKPWRPNKGATVAHLKTMDEIAEAIGAPKRTIQAKTQIARDILPEVKEEIRNTDIADSTTQLLKLARQEPEKQIEIAKAIAGGAENVDNAIREIAKENNKNKPIPEIPEGKYSVIYADPPWPVGSIVMDKWESPIDDKYSTMTIDDIKALPVKDLSHDKCSLFMWTTHTFLPEALEIIKEWGFKYSCCITWDKGGGWTQFGFHKRTEFLLYAYKGGINVNQYGNAIPTLITEKKTYHSKKPDSIRDLIRGKTPEPRLEMFARGEYEGWTVWGNEVSDE